MDIRAYQAAARATAIYPRCQPGEVPVYPMLGLCGETGEVAEKLKKIMRDRGNQITQEDLMALELEISDVCWYVSNLASDLGLDMGVILQRNLDKLSGRLERGTLQGSGDNR